MKLARSVAIVAGVIAGFASQVAHAQDSSWATAPINWNAMQQQSGNDCSTSVRQQQQLLQINQIDGGTAVAKQFYTPLTSGSFSTMSCLDKLMGSGLNIVFEPPSLSSLLNMIENAVCNAATSMVQQAEAPLQQSLNGALPVGQAVPGLNLGNLGMGVGVSPVFGNTNGNLVNTNINSVLQRPFGYNPQSFQGLFNAPTGY